MLVARRRSKKRRLFSEDGVADEFKDADNISRMETFLFDACPRNASALSSPHSQFPPKWRRMLMKRIYVTSICALVAALSVAGAAQLYSQDKRDVSDVHTIVHFVDLQWTAII